MRRSGRESSISRCVAAGSAESRTKRSRSFVTEQPLAVDGGLTAGCMPFPVDPELARHYGLAGAGA